ncbi:ABC transporter permease subunit [Sphaerochaeta sp. PS]|uniref:ABC transporter permease subunit n=1 Tax=Sphaerochaeta sp. PS TaxID=3076336 RepID=UPI0028A45C01|nr:sugar ABC transporter permease YjfF [Sphaerochaeta sp. PS]MDT4761090.1 sugar ABC transporter permease YjfF [Sphaerochaeta sp. PS]
MTHTRKRNLISKNLSLFITLGLFVLLFASVMVIGPMRSNRFKYLPVFFNLLNDNAYLLIASVGIMFVLITGNIDISVASTLAFSAVFSAFLLRLLWPAWLVIPVVLAIGFSFGALMGFLIEKFKLQSFIVTLAGLFFLRGMCSVVSKESIPIENGFYSKVAQAKITFGSIHSYGKVNIYLYGFVAIAVVLIALYILRYSKFGRCVYAIGGSEQSARLMGLPVRKVKILVYAISGFCASLGGVLFSFYTLAGYGLQNLGLELDAISSAVIGGTMLSGGVGSVVGTAFGVMIQGTIQTIVTLLNLNAWWTKVTVAALLCIFVILQRLIAIRNDK